MSAQPLRSIDETRRLAALDRYDILDTPSEAAFDDIARLASQICGVPIALVSLIDEHRQWFKARVGLDVAETPRDIAFCDHAIRDVGLFEIEDAFQDARFAANPLVVDGPRIRFYAGVPLRTPDGENLGTLCVIDRKPRELSPEQRTALAALARMVIGQLELRRSLDQERKAATAAAASDARYRRLLGATDQGFCVIEVRPRVPGGRMDYRFIEVNQAFAQQTGLQDPVGRWIRDLAPGIEEHWFEIYAHVADTGETARFEQHAKDLDARWFDAFAYRIGEPEERHVAILFSDITARRRAEVRLRELNEGLEALVAARSEELARVWNNSHDVMLVIGVDGLVRSLNPATTVVLGWSAPDLVGQPIVDFIHPEDRPPQIESGGLDPRRYDEGRVFKNRFRSKSGAERWIEWAVSTEQGMIYCYGRDVTEEIAKAEALAVTEQRLRQSQKMQAVGQLTGGLAHDFNNLLTGITGSLELLDIRIKQGRIDELDRYTAAARGAAKRASALTHRLLAFSRQQTLDPKSVDVNRLIGDMEELIRRSVGPVVQIEVVGAGGLWPTRVDPNQLENALLNLCINARDAMPDGGRITIETANKWLDDRGAQERDVLPGQYVSLCVTDTGTGMTKEVIERAFDPFFTTKPIGQGTGLGLSMIYGFARQSGGQVRIYSELGQGSTVCIYLPRDHHAVGAEAVSKPGEAVDLRGSGETVLVVDDEPTVRMLVTEVLHEFGYRSIEAGDGSAGLKVLQSDARVDLLITDVGLPGGMNGRQVADAARVFRPDLKVLFITGYAENAAVGNGQLDPGMQILTKPFSMDDLAKKIRAMVED